MKQNHSKNQLARPDVAAWIKTLNVGDIVLLGHTCSNNVPPKRVTVYRVDPGHRVAGYEGIICVMREGEMGDGVCMSTGRGISDIEGYAYPYIFPERSGR